MSDPYLDKLHEQRSKWVSEMHTCERCKANTDSRTPIIDHLQWHQAPALTLVQSDADIDYDHDAPSEHYPYKSKGMTDGDKMSPKKWKAK